MICDRKPPKVVTFVGASEEFNPYLAIDNHQLEDLGLALRPELRIEAYQQKVARQDVYKEAIKMLPGVGLIAGFNYNSNNLLFVNTWGELGVRASFNLFNMIQGPIAISAAKQAEALAVQRRIALSVADSGPGVRPEDRERVIDRFVRLETARSTSGAGLGLSLVAAVAEVHHADLVLEDGLGGPEGPGLRVTLTLPVLAAKG